MSKRLSGNGLAETLYTWVREILEHVELSVDTRHPDLWATCKVGSHLQSMRVYLRRLKHVDLGAHGKGTFYITWAHKCMQGEDKKEMDFSRLRSAMGYFGLSCNAHLTTW